MIHEIRSKLCDYMDHIEDEGWRPQILAAAIKSPSGAIEVITNHGDNIPGKLDYYYKAYDSEMRLLTNSEVQILDLMVV